MAADTDWMPVFMMQDDHLVLECAMGEIPEPLLEVARQPYPRGSSIRWKAVEENRSIFLSHYGRQASTMESVAAHFKGPAPTSLCETGPAGRGEFYCSPVPWPVLNGRPPLR